MASAPTLTVAQEVGTRPVVPPELGMPARSVPQESIALVAERRERLERMFNAHHTLIWRTLRRLGLSPDAATDTTQQVYLIAAERLADIRPESERAFLFGTAVRLVRSWRRKQARCELDAHMDERSSPRRSEDQTIARHSAMELMDRVLAHMDPDLVAVFFLFELEGLSTPEIATLTGVPLGTAASRLRRARLTFREAAARLERSTGSRP